MSIKIFLLYEIWVSRFTMEMKFVVTYGLLFQHIVISLLMACAMEY